MHPDYSGKPSSAVTSTGTEKTFLTRNLKNINECNKLELPDLPSHSQSVESVVKLTSEASHTIDGLESKHKHILPKALSRRMRPSFLSDSSYSENYDDFAI
ncbi:Hypothetical predicted protein [Octopus vulgaris]|uniref:Uncharacterized protein n=1 Tax=Octopus vulgaris TaxID=6645 RepID=A0AA36AK20_OCTVU|nr:Hypothetical predicted protein [Octopus vulgaris]